LADRFLSEHAGTTLEDAAIVVAYLGALGGPRHAQVVASQRGIVELSNRYPPCGRLAARTRSRPRAVCHLGAEGGTPSSPG
jgi:hypothetical protein